MKNRYFKTIATGLALWVGLSSCQDTWLTYDISQKDRLYFTAKGVTNLDAMISVNESFALLALDVTELTVTIPVYVMGQPSDHERIFEVEAIHDTTSNFLSGGQPRELVDAVQGEEYQLSNLVIPAGKVTGSIMVTVKRSARIATKTASLLLQIKESEQFAGLPRNYYRVLISDGDPACPSWWIYDVGKEWYMYLGEFTVPKYRKLLEFYHGIGDSNPELYAKLVELCGENIDKKQPDANGELTLDLRMGFMHSNANPHKLAWVRYVLCPMFDYYSTNYPDAERYTSSSVTITTRGWRNPDYNY